MSRNDSDEHHVGGAEDDDYDEKTDGAGGADDAAPTTSRTSTALTAESEHRQVPGDINDVGGCAARGSTQRKQEDSSQTTFTSVHKEKQAGATRRNDSTSQSMDLSSGPISSAAAASYTAAGAASAASDRASSSIDEKKQAGRATRNTPPKTDAAEASFRARRKGAAIVKSLKSVGGTKSNTGKNSIVDVESGKVKARRSRPETIPADEPPLPGYMTHSNRRQNQIFEEEEKNATDAAGKRPRPETISVQEPPHPAYHQVVSHVSEEEKQEIVSTEGVGRRTASSTGGGGGKQEIASSDSSAVPGGLTGSVEGGERRNGGTDAEQDGVASSAHGSVGLSSSSDIRPGAVFVSGPVQPVQDGGGGEAGAQVDAAVALSAPLEAYVHHDHDHNGEIVEAHAVVPIQSARELAATTSSVSAGGRGGDGKGPMAPATFLGVRWTKKRLVVAATCLLAAIGAVLLALGLSGTLGSSGGPTSSEPAPSAAAARSPCDPTTGRCWTQVGQTIHLPGDYRDEEAEFGKLAELARGGKTVVVSAPKYNLDSGDKEAGGVWVFDMIAATNDGNFTGGDGGAPRWEEVGSFFGRRKEEVRGWISRDGWRVAVGAQFAQGPTGEENVGRVDVYERAWGVGGGQQGRNMSASGWTVLGGPIYGRAVHDRAGKYVAFSANGTIVAVGAPSHTHSGGNPGSVRVYALTSEGRWGLLGSDLVGRTPDDQFGWSVSLSDDGTVIAVGARRHGDGNQGHVCIFRYDPSADDWVPLGQPVLGTAPDAVFGGSVSLSADGGTFAAADWRNDGSKRICKNGSCHAYVYSYDETQDRWVSMGHVRGESRQDRLGLISLSSDGGRLAVGFTAADGDKVGYARVYDYAGGGSWRQVGGTLMSDETWDIIRISVSLSEGRDRLAVGSPATELDETTSREGFVRIYDLE